MTKYFLTAIVLGSFTLGFLFSCKSGREGKSSKSRKADSIVLITSNAGGSGRTIEIEMRKGKSHNHPTFAIWLEDTNGSYIQTLFVTSAIGQGIFRYGDKSDGKWKPGEVRRPAAIPYWAHKRGVISENGLLLPTPRSKVPDAYSGATPEGSFRLTTKPDELANGKVKLMFEINQPWDFNEFWTNSLYLDDADYKTSCQPALVYSAIIDLDSPGSAIEMKPVGHSHYSGKSGELFPDLSTITSALYIADKIIVMVK
jgi:hypothetical protein